MRIVYFGSGAFGLPTFRSLARRHDLELVVTQPDRAAGRRRKVKPTPIGAAAESASIPIVRADNVNDPDVTRAIRQMNADIFIVIAFGQKLGAKLLADRFAINLHGSLLPKHRGAAPINRAIMEGDRITGLSVITVAPRMDAGDILGQTETPIDPHETAGELHDRLADLGPELVLEVLDRWKSGRLTREMQDEQRATDAPKLTKGEGTVRFDQPAKTVRNRIHGLTPWPGCRVQVNGGVLRLHRAKVVSEESVDAQPGTLIDNRSVACSPGCVQLLAVHPAGGSLMSFEAYARGRDVSQGTRLHTLEVEESTA